MGKKLADISELAKNDDWLGVGLALRHRQESKLYSEGNFRQYIESQDFGFGYRTAMNLIRMTKDMERLKYTEAQVRALIKDHGVSKAWIALRHCHKGIPYKDLNIFCEGFTNPQLQAFFKGESKVNFTARISADNHFRLVEVLKKHGLVESDKKALNAGPAFNAFLTRYFKQKSAAQKGSPKAP